MRTIHYALSAVLAVSLLAGCGGGGGSPTATALVITSSNSEAVAAEALQTATNFDAGSGGPLAVAVDVDSGSGSSLQLASAARKLVTMVPSSATQATGVTASETVACSGGGTLSVSATTSGGSTLTAGDSFSFTASSCSESGMVMNGSMTISVIAGNYDPSSTVYPKSITYRIVTTNFSITEGGETTVSNGDVTLALTEKSATDAHVVLSGSQLSYSIASAGGSYAVTLKDYSHDVTETASGTSISMSATVETTNSRLGSSLVSYTITTVSPIVVDASGVITAGSIKVTGSGSALLLTVTAPDTFSLELDTNGDGTYDSSTTVTRSTLQALL